MREGRFRADGTKLWELTDVDWSSLSSHLQDDDRHRFISTETETCELAWRSGEQRNLNSPWLTDSFVLAISEGLYEIHDVLIFQRIDWGLRTVFCCLFTTETFSCQYRVLRTWADPADTSRYQAWSVSLSRPHGVGGSQRKPRRFLPFQVPRTWEIPKPPATWRSIDKHVKSTSAEEEAGASQRGRSSSEVL